MRTSTLFAPDRSSRPATIRITGAILALAAVPALTACGGIATNRSSYSVHQPVVEQANYTLDLTTGRNGLAYGEQKRLDGWLTAMDLKYGDVLRIDDPTHDPEARQAVADVASNRGILLSDGAPITTGHIAPGSLRVILTRSHASVPSCPSWKSDSDFNPNNGLSANYGCSTNSNLAAMVANPEDLITGAKGDSETVVMTSVKAIEAYRKATPTGNGNTVIKTSSTSAGGN